MLGALLALVLVAAGEWTRRKENLSGLPGLPTAHIPGILTAAGTTVAYATVYAAYALYGFLPPGARVRSDGHRGAADAHGGAAARPRARRARRHRRVCGAAPGQHRATGLLGALHLHRRRHRGVVRAGALADVALAGARRHRAERRLDAARHGARCGRGGWRPRVQHACRLCARRGLPGVRIAVRPAGQARRSRPRIGVRTLGLFACGGAPRARKPARRYRAHRLRGAHRSDGRRRLARGSRKRRRAGGRNPRHGGDGALGGADESRLSEMARRPRRTGHRRTATLRLRLAPCARRRVGRAVRYWRIPRARPLDPRAGADAVERLKRVRTARHADCALLSHRRSRSFPAIRWPGAAARCDLRHRHRNAAAAGQAARHCHGERALCHRRPRRAGIGADLRTGKRLAHRCPCVDGASGSLDRGKAAAAMVAFACCDRGGAGDGARRL